MEKEVWKDIPGYEGKYQVSNIGNIRSNHRILKQRFISTGYRTIMLYKNGKHKQCKVHRLVALTFIPNPNNLPEINHKNEIKIDNRVENLEWCNRSYNINYGKRNMLLADKLSKTVEQYSLNNTYIACYSSTVEAERTTGIHHSHISKCCRGERHTAGGFKWKYKDE